MVRTKKKLFKTKRTSNALATFHLICNFQCDLLCGIEHSVSEIVRLIVCFIHDLHCQIGTLTVRQLTIDIIANSDFCVRNTLLDDGRAPHSPLLRSWPGASSASGSYLFLTSHLYSGQAVHLQTDNADAADVTETPDTTLKRQKQIWRRSPSVLPMIG